MTSEDLGKLPWPPVVVFEEREIFEGRKNRPGNLKKVLKPQLEADVF